MPLVVVEKFAKAYIDGYMTLLQHQLLYPPQPVALGVLLLAPRAETSQVDKRIVEKVTVNPAATGAVKGALY